MKNKISKVLLIVLLPTLFLQACATSSTKNEDFQTPEQRQASDEAFSEWNTCVVKAAARYSHDEGAPSDLADASMAECRDKEGAVYKAARVGLLKGYMEPSTMNFLVHQQEKSEEGLANALHQAAVKVIIDSRRKKVIQLSFRRSRRPRLKSI